MKTTKRGAFLAIVCVVGFGGACSGKRAAHESSSGSQECSEYVAAYRGCFDKLGPEARAAGERNMATAAARLVAPESGKGDMGERCKKATAQLALSCR
jgi:hypothetical protein